MIARAHLVRHTRPAIMRGICYGRTDVALAPTMRQDIEETLAAVPPVPRIVTSPASRCRLLAGALGERDGIDVSIDDRLQELDFGAWELRPWNDIPCADIDAWTENLWTYAPGGGESLASLWARVRDFRAEIVTGATDVVVVSHHGPLRALAALLADETAERMFEREFPWGGSSVHVVGQCNLR